MRAFPPRDCRPSAGHHAYPANYQRNKPARYVYFTQHAIDQSVDKFPALRAVRDHVGQYPYTRMLTACAGASNKTEHDTYVIDNIFLISVFTFPAMKVAQAIIFAAAPDKMRENYWRVFTSMTPGEIAGHGNCRK